jgi:hypothetical protein
MLKLEQWFKISKVTFGRLDAIQDFCVTKEVTYEEVVYDEMMQCQQVLMLSKTFFFVAD